MRQRIPCGRKALDLLSRRSHFEKELRVKLAKRGYEEAEVAETLERLRGQGLLDDRQTARSFVRGRLARAPQGRYKLRAELAKRGVASEIVTETLDDLLGDDDLELTRQAAERWRRTRWRPGKDPERQRASLARHLAGRGFSSRSVYAVLDEMPRGDGD
ncbi:MAG: regulatory protein RecX [bacterium]|nr:regulatory protein RecX [bacterium]